MVLQEPCVTHSPLTFLSSFLCLHVYYTASKCTSSSCTAGKTVFLIGIHFFRILSLEVLPAWNKSFWGEGRSPSAEQGKQNVTRRGKQPTYREKRDTDKYSFCIHFRKKSSTRNPHHLLRLTIPLPTVFTHPSTDAPSHNIMLKLSNQEAVPIPSEMVGRLHISLHQHRQRLLKAKNYSKLALGYIRIFAEKDSLLEFSRGEGERADL